MLLACFDLMVPNFDYGLDLGGLWFKLWFNSGVLIYMLYTFDYDLVKVGDIIIQ